ncbi:MAG: hypothetical protein JWM44_2719 [Bacilli bacterium]|nr:hypothetical protein [Bacilli bacterium]
MSTPLEVLPDMQLSRNNHPGPSHKKSYKLVVVVWFVLVGCGLGGAYLYTNYLKKALTVDLAQQNQVQLQTIQHDYQQQLSDLKASVNQEMTDLQDKVEHLNQLLAFTKDSASSKTDSSNQLYTQLAEVKKKLEELQKNLDVLK